MRRRLLTIWATAFAMAAPLACGAAQIALVPAPNSTAMLEGGKPTVSPAPTEIGTASSEVLRGNGTRAGYVLGHGNVIAGTETVYVGVKRAKMNIDYTLDCSSGSIFFSEPVDASNSVRVDYRYTDRSKSDRAVTGPGNLMLKFGAQSQANLTYSYRTANLEQGAGAQDVLTYGVNTTSKIGGASSISSMFYVATPQQANRMALTAKPPAQKKDAKKIKQDQLMVENADLGLGSMKFKVGYQNVGEDFAGFDALRDSGAAQTDILNQLDKEKGLKRLDLGSELKVGGDGALSFSRGSVEDKKGDIITQSAGYSGSRLRIGFSTRDVAKTFTRFNDLKEADRGQLANEAGLTRNKYFVQFRTMDSKDASAGWSSFTNTTLSAENGELTYRTAGVDLGAIKFEADLRSASPEFNSMKAVNDEERTRMALAARQQFDPRAQVSAVVAQDKAQVEKEAGLNRENYRAQYGMGPLWLSLATSNVSSQGGGLSRTDYTMEYRAHRLHLGRQRIDPKFTSLASMQPTELKHYGNESGMARTDMDGQFKLGFGDLGFARKHVADQQGATVNRDKIDFKNNRLEFHANMQSIDPRFSRLADLSDEDRQLLAKELGFNRSDYRIAIQATRGLKLQSYLYDSSNITAGQQRGQRKHELDYAGDHGLKATGLSDDSSYISDSGNISSYSRRKVTFDNTFSVFGPLLFKGMKDTNTSWEEEGDPVTTDVTQAHLETNPGTKTSFTLDSLQMDLGKGHFENTLGMGFRAQTWKRVALVGSLSRTDRDDKPEANSIMGLDWSMGKDLKMNVNVANRTGGPKGSQQTHNFTLNGTVVKKALGFEDVKVGSAVNTTTLSGKQTGCDNSLKVQGKFMRGDFTIDNGDKLNPQNGIYYSSRQVKYEKDVKDRYHLTYYRENRVTPTNEFARKRNYAIEAKVNRRFSTTASSYFGKDGQNGAVLPVGGGVFKLNYRVNDKRHYYTDYSADVNETTLRRARTMGLGFANTFSNGSTTDVYWGWSHLTGAGPRGMDTVFRVKYDHKLDPARYITLSAQKHSAVDKSTINPYEGNITANLEFRLTFH